MTRYISPAQARQDHHLRWHRMLHWFARLAGAPGSTTRRREPTRPDPEGQVVVFGPCGADVPSTPSPSRRRMRRRDRQPARDAEMEAGR
jgi:hypothetical protein